ncbi:uncharacterized protein LOC100892537 isoform X2 [Strongylocentrotus purpuratus]|uniref:Uncharacterized protein n=1 Tax=Strongylocentrotus purpuratus TaxID=7668 RepID=A0A7M7GG39_STRPU|nr:uncharacterized protein LOC100892537 isoform X2 [Strongylocentrotus purpuratus]
MASSSGKITAHNLHLLQDDPDDVPGDGEGAMMPDNDLNLRTETAGSLSSVDSRQMDESPVDDRASPANLSEEAKYQEELKERVKKSFADLGIEPEGVLLKDSLDDTPRDPIEIKEDLPYEEGSQGEYDSRRRKENVNNNVNEDEIDSSEELGDDRNDLDNEEEHPLDDDDNFLADSLEAATPSHQGQPDHRAETKNIPLHPDDDNVQESDDNPPEFGVSDEPHVEEDEDEDDFVRDSLETGRAESELHNLNDSNPIGLGDEGQEPFDGDASDSFPTPINHTIPDDVSPEERDKQSPHLSEPLQPEDIVDDGSAEPLHVGEDIANNHGEEETFNDAVEPDEARAPSELAYEDLTQRTLNGNDDDALDGGYGNGGPENDAQLQIGDRNETPLEHDYDDDERQSYPLTGGSVLSNGDHIEDGYPNDVQSTGKKPMSSDSRQQESRENSSSLSNLKNNSKGPHGRPPSGGSIHSVLSNLNSRQSPSRQRDPVGVIPSPGHQTSSGSRTPVRSRDNSRERGMSSRSRQSPSDRSRHTPADGVSSATSRPLSGNRNGSSKPRYGSGGSRHPDSREGERGRRGSNDINIPRYSRKGMNNSDIDNESLRENLRNTENREYGARSGSGKLKRLPSGSEKSRKEEPANEPNHADLAMKPPPGPPRQNLTSPIASLATKKPSPRDFMTPGQRMEVDENKQFWSDMHQAGVFNQPVNPSAVNPSTKPRNDQVEKMQLKNGEKVRVEYISDDSGDEDLHFVDEKGSPIDQLGRPLFAPQTPATPDLRIMYRMKPSPPRQKSNKKSSSGRQRTRDVSAADSSRYGSGFSTRNGSGNKSGREGSRIPVRQPVDRQVSPIEDEILSVETQQEGILDTTIPTAPPQQEPPRERPVKSASLQTGIDDPPPPEDVEESDFKRPVQEASIQTVARESAIQTSDGDFTGNNDNTLPYQSPLQSPRHTREVAPFGQVRVAPYQQQQGPGYQPPLPGYHQQGPMPFPAGAYAQQIQGNYQGNPQAHWQPVMGQQGYPNQGQQFAAPLQPQFMDPLMSPGMNQQMPPQMMPNYPGPQYHPQMQNPTQQVAFQPQMPQQPHPVLQNQYQPDPQGYMESPGRPYPGQDMEQPYTNERDTSGQSERKQSGPRRQQPKPKHNFIDLNKTSAKLRRDPPNKKYTENLNQKKGFKSPMNPRKPLPHISRESSLDDSQASSTGWTPHGSATSRSNDQWAQAVQREQQMILLARGMSDPNIYPQGQGPPGHMRNASVPGSYAGGTTYQGGYPTPDTNPNQVNGQPYSWSADRANTYARMNAMQNANQAGMGGPFGMDPRGSFEVNQTSPRQRMAYTHPMPSNTSPFQVLPDIHNSGRRSGEDKELRTSDPDGYLTKLQKQKQGPQYRPYTLKDFQNLKKDFKLGGLGPDKETMGFRSEKVARQRDYARQVMEQNKKIIRTNPNAGNTPGKDSPQTEASKRELALEYAKQIPKPRIPTPPEVLHDRLYGSGANSRSSGAGSRSSSVREETAGTRDENTALEMARLQELTQRHNQEKDALDRLRKGTST